MTHPRLYVGRVLVLFWFFFISPVLSAAQDHHSGSADFEEILLELNVERELSFDYSARLRGEQLYLPVTRLFSILKVRHDLQLGRSRLKVRFGRNEKPLAVNYDKLKFKGPNSTFTFKKHEFFVRDNELYFHRDLLEKLFDFSIIFNYRKLEIMLFSKRELRVVGQHKRKERYRHFQNGETSLNPEIVKEGRHRWLSGWIMNWNLNSSHTLDRQRLTYGSGLGGEILGGDLSMRLSGSKEYGIHWNTLRGRWRYPIYNSSLVTRITAGHQSIESQLGTGHHSFKGINITNRPLSTRHKFARRSVSNSLDPGWDAELVRDGRLQDVARADDNEFYRFTVPLNYGTNVFTVNRFDRDGFNHPQNYRIYIPHDVLPPNTFEYDLSLGRLGNPDRDLAKFDFNWGLSPHLTVGGGSYYMTNGLNHLTRGQVIPYTKMGARLGSSILLKAGHTLNHMSRASTRIILPDSRILSFNFKKHHRSSIFNRKDQSMSASVTGSLPLDLPFGNFNTYLSAEYKREKAGNGNLNMYGSLSTTLPFNFRLNINAQGQFHNPDFHKTPDVQRLETRFTLSKRILGRLLLRPRATYSYTRGKITHSNIEISSRVFKRGQISFSVNHNHIFGNTSLSAGFSIDFSYGRHSSKFNTNNRRPSLNQQTSGTVAFNGNSGQLHFDRRDWTNKAAVTLDPFLDLNENSKKDPGEPSISGLKGSAYKKGKAQPTYRDQSTFTRLAPYERYIIRIDEQSLSNPLWEVRHKTLQVRPDPNQFTRLPVPVVATGEVSGRIEAGDDINKSKLYGLNIHIESESNAFSETIQTYNSGSFYYVGLKPGEYTATLDQKQLTRRSIKVTEDSMRFTITSKKNGDIVDGVNMGVASKRKTADPTTHSNYGIQIGAFRIQKNATRYAEKIKSVVHRKVWVVYDPFFNVYQCQIRPFNGRTRAIKKLEALKSGNKASFEDAFIFEIDPGER